MTQVGRFWDALVLSCEHGGNVVPKRFKPMFRGAEKVLETHRGLDIGAAKVAKKLSHELHAPLHLAITSRLIVDLNRSPRHPRLLSEYMSGLGAAERQRVLQEFYWPYRQKVEAALSKLVARKKRVLHLSVHSFTPSLNGEMRTAEVGFLYDPRRRREKEVATYFCRALSQQPLAKGWRIRRNYPYLGISDGFVTYLRRQFRESFYMGIELEMNQALLATNREIVTMVTNLNYVLSALNPKLVDS